MNGKMHYWEYVKLTQYDLEIIICYIHFVKIFHVIYL